MFVVLSMDMAEVKKRVLARHSGNESLVEIFEVEFCNRKKLQFIRLFVQPVNKICDPVGEDEKNAVTVTVTADMTKEDVLTKILEMVN